MKGREVECGGNRGVIFKEERQNMGLGGVENEGTRDGIWLKER